jgi:transmembrane sensor
MAAVLVFAFYPRHADEAQARVTTVALHPDSRVLPDGSTIELNVGAEVTVDFRPEQRNVRLVRGEALFQVAKDPTRPFVVTAGAVAVRAVGTAFAVRLESKLVDVLVTEGLVSVEQGTSHPDAGTSGAPPTAASAMPARVSPAPVSLAAGRRLSLPAGADSSSVTAQPVSPAEVARALAWRARRVEFNGTPLSEAVAMFNRANAVQLAVANAATGDLRISGVFWTNDSEAFSRVIETSLGITAAPDGGGRIVFRK